MEREIPNTRLAGRQAYWKLAAIAAVSFLLSITTLLDRCTPFNAALLGSLSGGGCIVAFAASMLGYIIKGNLLEAFPSITAMVAIGAFRLMVGRYYARWVQVSSALLTGAAVFFTSIVTAEAPSDIIIAAGFAVVAGVSTGALFVCYRLFSTERSLVLLKPMNIASLGIVYTFGIAALTGLELGVMNLGITLAAFITLTLAERFRYAGGAVGGAVAAFGIGLASGDYISGALVLCFAGVACPLFHRLGKLTQAAGFILAGGVATALLGVTTFTLNTMAAVFISSLIFIALPTARLADKFRKQPKARPGADISEIFSERLKLAGDAMGDVQLAVEKTAEILDKRGARSLSWVYDSTGDIVCRKCRHNTKCWGEHYDDTARAMNDLVKLLRQGSSIKSESLPYHITQICPRKEQLVYTLNTQYREYTGSNAANRRIAEMRAVLTAQLGATQRMMLSMSEEFTESAFFDRAQAASIEAVLTANGIREPRAAVQIADGRISVEAYGKGMITCDAGALCTQMSAALRHDFDLPDIVSDAGKFRMSMYERAVYSIEYGVHQVARGSGKNCGDYYDSFIDGKGYAYVILSDGMGSGGRARIDSAFACGMLTKLLRAGISLDAAIEIINNSLLVKSADESFATLDICKIDLYSGRVELYKAGGAPSYIKCNKRVVKANGRGLPVGISHKPVYEQQSFTIGNADIVIMASDGAELSEKWLEHELGKSPESMEKIAETIAEAARFTCEKGREDDISVIAVKLVK